MDSESDKSFVTRKTIELEAKFQELGPKTIIRFVCEPVVGAALGYVLSVPDYLKAMRDICYRHSALFILDKMISNIKQYNILHA
jgi:adenosylmethionine-8-amino-7-oxononanoate aminotransferase